jgi:hypothetical protein
VDRSVKVVVLEVAGTAQEIDRFAELLSHLRHLGNGSNGADRAGRRMQVVRNRAGHAGTVQGNVSGWSGR